MLSTFEQFVNDQRAYDMYITGVAGTGKTTSLAHLVQYCIDNDIKHTVCAFTHKACGILADKLPADAVIRTLHSHLAKRPSINTDATRHKHVQSNVKCGESGQTAILFVDEYSMVGERDLMDLRADQEEDDKGNPSVKIVWVGDPHQLPPVGDMQSVRPYGKYQVVLDKIHRTGEDNPLRETLAQLVSFIEGAPVIPLIESKSMVRGQDIATLYQDEWWEAFDVHGTDVDAVILAFTNRRVQELNAIVQRRHEPVLGDAVFSPTTKQYYTFKGYADPANIFGISLPFGDTLELNSKFKTLEYILKKDYKYAILADEEGNEAVFATIFGHYDHKCQGEEYKRAAADANAAIEAAHPDVKATAWARQNKGNPLERARAKAWRDFLSFDECVICIDFAHALTVHKSQGSTYHTVYVDTDDIGVAADFDYKMYLKLMYVAISRASHKVITT